MQLDTGNVTSPTAASSQRLYVVHCAAGLTQSAKKVSAMATQRIKIITHANAMWITSSRELLPL
jgi:ribosomal protein L22